MLILGIESSADETAAAVVEDGNKLLSNAVASSLDLHKAYGGIVPEIAARSHIEAIIPVIDEALKQAKTDWQQIDAIAVTHGPGLLGSLLMGVLTAKTLAIAKNKPLIPVNHVQAHVYAAFLTSTATRSPASERSPELRERFLRDAALEAPMLNRSSVPTSHSASRFRLASHQIAADVTKPRFPFLALIVSGGHTQLVLFKSHQNYQLLGQTSDDAAGEAYDKVAKMLGLPYPGGPAIEKLAPKGDPHKFRFPTAKMDNMYDFSFSGLKTAVLRVAQVQSGNDYTFPSSKLPEALTNAQKADIAASFMATINTTLAASLAKAADEFKPRSIVVAGGVAASQALRRTIYEHVKTEVIYPPTGLCTDNAAMVAALAFHQKSLVNPNSIEVIPGLLM